MRNYEEYWSKKERRKKRRDLGKLVGRHGRSGGVEETLQVGAASTVVGHRCMFLFTPFDVASVQPMLSLCLPISFFQVNKKKRISRNRGEEEGRGQNKGSALR